MGKTGWWRGQALKCFPRQLFTHWFSVPPAPPCSQSLPPRHPTQGWLSGPEVMTHGVSGVRLWQPPPGPGWLSRSRSPLLCAAVCAGCLGFSESLVNVFPLQQWLLHLFVLAVSISH